MSGKTILTVGFSIGFLVIASSTFAVWMRPPHDRDGRVVSFPMVAAITGFLFFLSCFALGVWFSLARLKGELWTL